MRGLVGEEAWAEKEGVGSIQFPAVDTQLEQWLLESMPPSHRLGVGVIDEPTLTLPPPGLSSVAGEVTFASSLVIESG